MRGSIGRRMTKLHCLKPAPRRLAVQHDPAPIRRALRLLVREFKATTALTETSADPRTERSWDSA